MTEDKPILNTPIEKPPVFKSWRTVYALVVAVLVIEVLLFWWITIAYN